MWASRPSHHDNDMPIDLRKKVVLQRDLEERKESRRPESVFTPTENNHYQERWHQSPVLPVGNLYPFMSERYGVRCSLVNADENRGHEITKHGSRGALETAIRKLHYNSQLKKDTGPPREERCRSTDTVLENHEKDESLESKRSSSCPNLTIIKPKPSPIKPKSSFIQRSSGYISDGLTEPNTNSNTSSFHQEHDDHSNSHPMGGAKKRKSFIPVYGDRAASPKRPRSPTEHTPCEEYFSHPEILLRRQLQQHSPSPYLVHVYDYYQQLVQRLREHSSPGVRLPPPVSPPSADDDMSSDPQRKRPCRALTGKHVKQGTGASLSTLLTLRQKIQERQKAKEHEPRNGFNGNFNKNMSPKKNKSQKTKPSTKHQLHKIQNC